MGVARLLALPVFALLAAPHLAAQCPDGSPPPCLATAPPAHVLIDSNAVAILPFTVRGPKSEVAWLREGLMDLLNISLDDIAGWRVVRPNTLLRRTRAGGGVVDLPAAYEITRTAGARALILGTAVVVGPELRLRAELYDAGQRRRIGTAVEARGPAAAPGPAIDGLAAGLAKQRLAQHPAVVRRRIEEYTTSSPAALRAYLVAEQLARRSAWQAAAESLDHALALDSTFGLAYYRLYLVRMFGDLGLDPGEPVISGLRYRARLPSRQEDLLIAARAEQRGLRWEALRAADQLARLYPDDAEAAFEQGEIYFHYGLVSGQAPAQPRAAFERALQLDPGMQEPYLHVIELQCLMGDSATAWQTLRRSLRQSPSLLLRGLQAAMQIALRGEHPANVVHALPPEDPEKLLYRTEWELLRLLDADPARAVALADSVAVLALARSPPSPARANQLIMRHAFLLAQGRVSAAWDVLQQAAALPTSGVDAAIAAHFLITGGGQSAARDAAARLATPDPHATRPAILTGWLQAVAGDTAALEQTIRGFRILDPWDEMYYAARAAGFRGLAALGRGDTTQARRLLAAARDVFDVGPPPHLARPDGAFALALARLYLDTDELKEATRILLDTFLAEALPYRAEAEELRGQIAQQQDDTATAIRAYRNFIALWQDADPALQPRVAVARTAVARLERR